MTTDALTTLQGNLEVLPPVTQRAITAADSDNAVQIHTAGPLPSASVRTPDGRLVRVHSGRDPVTEAEQFVESALGALPGGAPSVVMVLGPGLGYSLEAIARRAPGTRMIAIEPFPALARAMLERRDWREWIESKRLIVLVGPEYLAAGDTGRMLNERAAASAAIIAHPVIQREWPAAIARARAAADHVVSGALANAEARKMFAGRYLLNTLRNLRALLAEGDVSALRDVFSKVPAIVVAAGPSLDRSLDRLRAIGDGVLIVAVDTTLRPLGAAGIRPHVVVAVDPSELNARHLLDLEDTAGTWLVSEGSIDPRVFPNFAGRTFAFKVSDHQPWPWLRTYGFDRGTLRAWGSVLTTAFDFAIHAGCDPIVFVGADLAFTGGVHYCRGTMNEAEETLDAPDVVRAEGFAEALRQQGRPTSMEVDIRGARVVSTPAFVQFRDWLVARALEASPRAALNATGNGILHGAGITQVDLQEMSFPSGGADIAARLKAAWLESLDDRRRSQRALEEVLAERGSEAVPKHAWQEFVSDEAALERITGYIAEAWRSQPLVSTQPQCVCRLAGSVVRFTSEAAGAPAPVVQWQVSSDGGKSWSDIDGATAATYETVIAAGDNGKQVRAMFTNTHGSASSEAAAVTVSTGVLVYDFNGDGKPDVFWRDPATGANEIWYLDRITRTGIGRLIAVPDTLWIPAAVCDLTGHGKTDMLWRYMNGHHSVWHMDGIERAGSGTIDPEEDLAWIVVATGDFDGNSTSDILWHHTLTGATSIWYMDGLSRLRTGSLGVEPDLAWRAVAVGDFNGDGKLDLIWRNSVTGQNRVWFLDGERRVADASLDAEPDSAWQIVGTGDFNGDGHADLLWRNGTTGEMRVWYLDGVRRTGVESFILDGPHTTVISAEELKRRSK